MKKILLPALLLVIFICAKANDTLTRAQIYNFAVGDTFDYLDSGSHSFSGNGPVTGGFNYERFVIDRLYYSQNSDTLIIVRRKEYPLPVSYDSLIISRLSSYEINSYSDFTASHYCDTLVGIDTSHSFNGRTINGISGNCFESSFIYQFVDGLGETFLQQCCGSLSDGSDLHQKRLIYYSKGNERWGTQILNGADLLHYTPLPEECAVWTDIIYSDFPPLTHNNPGIKEQIRSGNRIAFNGHAYVEMIYRSYNYLTHYYTPDSLMGYYRNDTANKKALFFTTLSDSSFKEYDFDVQCPAPNCLTQIMVGGQLRTKWPDYIEGVGGLLGLIPVKKLYFLPQGYPFPFSWGAGAFSFCVCGQVQYATDTTLSCDLISEIVEPTDVPALIKVYPSPALNVFYVQIFEEILGTELILFDAMGNIVRGIPLTSNQTAVERKNLPAGVYFWQVLSEKKIVGRGKVLFE